MNKERRKTIKDCIEKINSVKDELESIMSDEIDYRDSMPDNFRSSEKWEIADNAIANLEEAINQLDEAMFSADSAME